MLGLVANRSSKAQEEQDKLDAKQKQQINTIMQVSDAVTGYVNDAMSGQLDQYANFGESLILMSLGILKQMVPIWSAEILGYSLASPESVATWGALGIAKWTAITALMEGAISLAEGAIRKKINKRQEVNSNTTITRQRSAGKYDVIGAEDGRTYRNVPYVYQAQSGIYANPTLISENGGETILTAGHTARIIRMNPQLMNAVMAYRDPVPQRAAGNYGNVDQSPAPIIQSDPQLQAIMIETAKSINNLNETLKNPLTVDMMGKNGVVPNLGSILKYINSLSK